ncbi:MAG: PBP1A family penicillin-binding protein [Polyangiaceae bacterium]|nr:PBP1A family penicillin-binding protein [Polyangiaceae bacterium]
MEAERRGRERAEREQHGARLESGADRARSKKRRGRLQTVLLWLRRLALLGVALFGAGCFAFFLVLRHYEQDLPSLDDIKQYDPPQVSRILARDGTLLAEVFIERRTVVGIDAVPQALKLAVLAAEDAEFYEHDGLDYLGMLRALWVNVRSGSMRQGGSTITQQVVKNLLLTQERTFARKCKEVLLARRIEQALSKDEILELYLNHIYLGHGRYGVEEASRYYFGKGVSELGLAEAALLAGLPKGPSIYSPRVDLERSRKRRDWVLEQMGEKGFATAEAVAQAKAERVVLAPAAESMNELAPEVVDEVERLVHAQIGDGFKHGGYSVTTTIDPALQASARAAVRKNLDAYAERHKLLPPFTRAKKPKKGDPTPFQGTPEAKGRKVYWAVVTGADDPKGTLAVRVGTAEGVIELGRERRYNPKSLPPSRFAEPGALVRVSAVTERGVGPDGVPTRFRLELGPEGALVAIDPRSAEVVALVGGYDAVRGGLDRATFAHRQPGSSFKPFVYATALAARKLTPATLIELPAPPTKPGVEPGAVPPPLRARVGLAQSVNAAAQWVLRTAGAENVIALARRLGVTSRLEPTDSLALGAYEVTPRELAAAYGAFANGGVYRAPVLVRKIVAPDGRELALAGAPVETRALDEDVTYVLTSMLTSVVEEGTAVKARSLGRPVAGKTGTSNDAKDAWFAGFTPDFTAVVWTGYDDAVPLGRGESGAVSALPAFIDFMREAHRGLPARAFAEPAAGIRHARIDPRTGLLAYADEKGTLDEVFLAGSEPTEPAEPPDAGPGDEADAGAAEVPDAGAATAPDAGPESEAPLGELADERAPDALPRAPAP